MIQCQFAGRISGWLIPSKRSSVFTDPKRDTETATALDSVVHYARWIQSDQPRDGKASAILNGIRNYQEEAVVASCDYHPFALIARLVNIGHRTSGRFIVDTNGPEDRIY